MKRFKLLIILISIFATIDTACQDHITQALDSLQTNAAKLEYLEELVSTTIYSDPTVNQINIHIYDSIAHVTNDSSYVAKSYNLKGMLHYVKGQYDLSIEAYIKALQLKSYISDQKKVAKLFNNLATSYQVRGDLKNSLKYFTKALHSFEATNDTLWAAHTNGNLGLLLLNNKELDTAEPKIRKALAYYKNNDHTIYEGYTLLNLGNLLNEKGDYKQSIPVYQSAILKVPETVNPIVAAAAYSGIGVAHSRLTNFSRAVEQLNLGLSKSAAIPSIEQEIICHQELAKVHEEMRMYAKSLQYHKNYTTLKDSAFTMEQDIKMTEALAKYESEINEQELALLNTQHQLTETRLLGTRRFTTALLLGFLILAALLYRLFKLNKSNRQAAEEKDTLLREIHHRVKNNLQVVSALLTLQSKYINDDQAVEALREGQDRVQSMALIHKDLYQHDNLKGVNTKDYIEKLVENLMSSYNIEASDITLHLNIASLWIDVDTMIPMGLLINELISNALKHAFIDQNGGTLTITLEEGNGALILEVADNGKGFTDFDNQRKGSFGYSLIESFAQKLNADIDVNTEQGFSISMNIKNYTKAA